MVNTTIPVTANMDEGLKRVRVEPLLMTNNNQAHVFEVTVLPTGSLVGSNITATLVRADGVTVQLDGTADGDVAKVTLSKACYSVTGRAKLTITASTGDTIASVLYAELNVVSSRTDAVVDPDNVIPSLEDITSQLAAMVTATENAEAATDAANAAKDDADTATAAAVNATSNATDAATAANTAAQRANTAADAVDAALSDKLVSVNGKTGIVELDAADVGALPDSTTYVESINGQTGAVVISDATTEASGLMSAGDKTKLDVLPKITFGRCVVQTTKSDGTVTSGVTLTAGEYTTVTTTFDLADGDGNAITTATSIALLGIIPYGTARSAEVFAQSATSTTATTTGSKGTITINLNTGTTGTHYLMMMYAVLYY